MTTNLFKKEFVNHLNSFYCIGLALNCLGNIATRDLGRDCISDVLQLMTHPQPYIRKKAIITMYKIYIKFPQGFRITFEQLKARLDDDDGSVVSCAVNVICELAHKNPRNYLAMAPKFFKLLTTSSNNWMLIKVGRHVCYTCIYVCVNTFNIAACFICVVSWVPFCPHPIALLFCFPCCRW